MIFSSYPSGGKLRAFLVSRLLPRAKGHPISEFTPLSWWASLGRKVEHFRGSLLALLKFITSQ
jgi:hypothetical protein